MTESHSSGSSACVREDNARLFAVADHDVRDVSGWVGSDLDGLSAGRRWRSIAGDDSAADHGAGQHPEEPTAAEARPFLENYLGPLVVDGETMAPLALGTRTLTCPPSLPRRPLAMDEQERPGPRGVRP